MQEDFSYYKYVPHHQKQKWEDAGWVFSQDLGPPHAAYASLYVWPRTDDPVVPDGTDVIITSAPSKDILEHER